MLVPSSVLAAGWVPFSIVLVLTLVFAFVYIRYYQSRYDKELCSTLASIVGLAVALLTCAIVPVDIFLVSFMKNSNGTFKSWAQDHHDRQLIVSGVLYAYYALYCVVLLFVFFILPFAYFYYEEGDEEEPDSTRSKCCGAFKYTIVFVLMALLLILVGAFVPWRVASDINNSTMSDWDAIKNIFHDLGTNHGEDALCFTINILTSLGYLLAIIYTAYGMSAWPMDLIKGRRDIGREQQEVQTNIDRLQVQIDEIRAKSLQSGRPLSRRDRQKVEELEQQQEVLRRRLGHLQVAHDSTCRNCCRMAFRPLGIVLGVVCLLLALLVFLSLLLSNIDKILYSFDPHTGYINPKPRLPNPLDMVLLFSQRAFPLDYVLMTGLVLYFVFCSMGGLSHIGVWICCVRMYKIRPQHTKPQGLLFLCFLLSFIVLAMNVLFYQMAPQYTTYGSQHYWKNETIGEGNHTDVHRHLVPCSSEAPADECVMTRMAMLIMRFCFKMWIFGAAYYWASWAFLLLFLIGFIVAVVRKRRSSVEGAVDRDDIMDSDEELLEP